MKELLVPCVLSIIFLAGCGGSHHKKTPASSSVSSMSSISNESSTSSTSTSSSSSMKSSSLSSFLSSSTSSNASTSSSQATSSIPFTITSNSFVADGNIPIKYSCFSTEVSPHLKWDITSDDVKSFTLIMEDKDAIAIVGYPYVHWDVYNIPGSVREITEGATLRAMPAGSIEGANDDNIPKYSGPCPPTGTGTHHYYFALYALNTENLAVDVNHSMKRSEFETRYASNIIQKVEIIGLFKP